MPAAPGGCSKRAPTCATPTPCWPGSLTTGRTSTPGRGSTSYRRWICTAPCCSRSPASSVRPGDPPDTGPHRGPVRRPSPRPYRTAGNRSRQAARGRAFMAEDQHTPRPRRAAIGRPAGPGHTERSSRRRTDGGADRDSRDRPVDRARCPHHRAAARRRRPAGRSCARKAVQAAYQLDHLPIQQEVLAIAEKWRPYRSLATSYLFSAAFEPAGHHRPADTEALELDIFHRPEGRGFPWLS